jgi:hypothetical protein
MEPRFDNLYSQMPNLGVSDREAELMADYLLAGREQKSRLERVLGRVLPEQPNYNHILYFALGGFVLGGATLAVVQFAVKRFRPKAAAAGKSAAERGQVVEAPR